MDFIRQGKTLKEDHQKCRLIELARRSKFAPHKTKKTDFSKMEDQLKFSMLKVLSAIRKRIIIKQENAELN